MKRFSSSRLQPCIRPVVLLALAAGAGVLLAPVSARAAVVKIAITGDAAPGGIRQMHGFGRPSINNSGQVGFTSDNFDPDGELSNEGTMNLGSVMGGPILEIAHEDQVVPGGNGTIAFFSFAPGFNDPIALNDSGQFGLHARLTDTSGEDLDDRVIYFGSGGSLTEVVRGGQPLPDGNGDFYRFASFALNSVGQVAFSATLQPVIGGTAADTGLYIGSGTGLPQKVVREGESTPDGNGTYSTFSAAALSDSGKVAFYSELVGTTGSPANNQILALGSGTAAPVTLARKGQLVPGGDGRFLSLGPPVINSANDVVFAALMNFTAVPLDDQAIFRAPGPGGLELVVRENESAPDGNGLFRTFTWSCLNNSGRIAVHATISDSAGGVNDGDGIFLFSGGLPRRQVVRRNFSAPGGGSFASLDDQLLAFNNSGQVAFRGNFNGGGSGIFMGNGLELVQVIREGQSLAGSTVRAATLLANIPVSEDHRSAINDHGQVAFFATLSNFQEGVFVFTPVITFQGSASSSFNDGANWTLGIPPGLVHDVLFNPSINVNLLGPASSQAVKSLQVGGGAGTATLQMQSGVTLSVADDLTIAANGVLSGEGTVAGNVVNGGLISPGTSAGKINVGTDLTQLFTGRMLFELGGTTAGNFDQLDVGQTLHLAGALDVVLIDGFTPQVGQTFDLINGSAINGTFEMVNLPLLPAGLAWDLTSLNSSGTLGVMASSTNALEAWRQQYFYTLENSGNAADTADMDGDGMVNFVEFALRTHPVVANQAPVSFAVVGGNLEYTYTRNNAALGLATYAVQWSDSLAPASWSTTNVTDVLQSDDGTVQVYKATLPVGGQSRFVRLLVTKVAP